MKKILSVVCIMLLCASMLTLFAGCFLPREQVLKVLNWEDYIDKGDDEGASSIITDFQNWYYETFNEKIKVTYRTADTNEDMYTKISKSKMDYDLICPSDYMIERMYNEDLLLPFNFSQLPSEVDNNIGYISPYITETLSKQVDPTGNLNKYFVGYMWGTMGILYNRELLIQKGVAEKDVDAFVSSINALWAKSPDGKTSYSGLSGQIWMKKSIRDTYIGGAIYANRTASAPYSYLNAASDSDISKVLTALKEQKAILKGYEVDEGKTDMIKGSAIMSYQWAGDAKYSIEEAKAEHDRTLEYSVPTEGSNVFFDGWVMPKYAKNTYLAQLFVNYMCDPENAIRNMSYIGYTSCVASADLLNEFVDTSFPEIDLSYFFGAGVKAKVDPIYYPTIQTLARCAVMRDFGSRNEAVKDMWSSLMAYRP